MVQLYQPTLPQSVNANGIELLAHRGLWKSRQERNSLTALKRALDSGYGLETDLRDRGGEVVISHDPPAGCCLTLRELLQCYVASGSEATLALNIKSDGLATPVAQLLAEHAVKNYFVFDMSIPDMLACDRAGLQFFTRCSEYEPHAALYERASGIWLDAFEGLWFEAETIQTFLDDGKAVCIVSPELHGREPDDVWKLLESVCLTTSGRLMLCTDRPDQWAERAI